MACNTAEIEAREKQERAIALSTAYVVEMTGASFSPPSSRVRRGQTAPQGLVESMIIDAHSGMLLERLIDNERPGLTSLGAVTELVAVLPSEISGAPVAIASRRSRGVATGTVVGRVRGPHADDATVVLSAASSGNGRGTRVVQRATTSSRGTFRLNAILPGHYGIVDSRGGCSGERITVKAGHTTHVTLSCVG
jgi:hypothetical protein